MISDTFFPVIHFTPQYYTVLIEIVFEIILSRILLSIFNKEFPLLLEILQVFRLGIKDDFFQKNLQIQMASFFF